MISGAIATLLVISSVFMGVVCGGLLALDTDHSNGRAVFRALAISLLLGFSAVFVAAGGWE